MKTQPEKEQKDKNVSDKEIPVNRVLAGFFSYHFKDCYCNNACDAFAASFIACSGLLDP